MGDLAEKFWKEYHKADLLVRDDKLGILVHQFKGIEKIKDNKMRAYLIKTILRGYIDDIFDYFDTK